MVTSTTKKQLKTYQDDLGNPIILGKELARGGEGMVCLVQGNNDIVAKIYLDKALQKHDKTGKIKAMCDLYDQDIARFSALPQKAVFNSKGKVVGFIMEKISNFKEIHNLYGIPTKRKLFDFADWGFMVHAAKNLAIAVDKLHSKNIIIGDINQGNILVDNQAMIKLIDCDSYQVEHNGKFYLCEVGVPEYTSPELQGQSFNGIHRTKNHDCFGLAVMIFKILMFGRHPYSGVGAPPEIENAIKQGYYCYGNNSKNTTPIYSQLFFGVLSNEVKDLFERAFSKNQNIQRPTAEEWINTLECLEHNLIQCPSHHKYYNNGNHCIWCELSKFGFSPFDNPVANIQSQNKLNYQQTPYNISTNNYKNQNNVQSRRQSYYSNYNYRNYNFNKTATQTNPKKKSDNYIWQIILGVLLIIGFIGYMGNKYDNNSQLQSNQQQINNSEKANEMHKVYTEAEKQDDIKAYKDKFINKVRSNWHPDNEGMPLDNMSIEVNIDKTGSVNCTEYTEVSTTRIKIMNSVIQSGAPYDPLPESYDGDWLTFKVYFEGNEVAKDNYQVSLTPIKATQKKTDSNTPVTQKTESAKSTKSAPQNASKAISKKTQSSVSTPSKSDLQKSSDWFFE